MKSLLFIILFLLTALLSFSQSGEKAHIIHEAIKEENRTLDNLQPNVPADLPLGISSQVAGQEYIIGIEELVLSPSGSFMAATASIETPLTGDKLAFASNSISISPGGIKGAASGQIALADDVSLPINNNVKLTLNATERKTFVSFDCNGFQTLSIQGEFEFCRNFLIPETPDGKEAPEPARVKAKFETVLNDGGNILAKVSITPFQLPALKGFGFHVQDAWVDKSDYANPLGILFPQGYQSPAMIDGANMWQGFFIGKASVKLPTELNSKGSSARKEIMAHNLIIDDMGISGSFSAKNLINFQEGSLSGWPFSVDSIAVSLASNKLIGAGFKGNINLPIAKETTQLGYTALIEEGGNYFFSVTPKEKMEVPLWGATMNLYPSSSITIALVNDKFIPTANLTGDINLKPDLGNGGDKGEFKGITFENLIISGAKPYITPGSFAIESRKNNMSGFALTINKIGLVNREEKVGLHLDLALHLMKDEDAGFSGSTGITILGKMEESANGRQKWNYDKVELDNINVNIEQGNYSIKGHLSIYRKHAVFGSGYAGSVDAVFAPKLAVSAKAQFGCVNGMRYWYVDGLVKLPQGMPIFTGVSLYGFGGGMYYHMKQKSFNKVNLDQAPASTTAIPAALNTVQDVSKPSSGVEYVPDEKTFLGLKASVILGTAPTPEAFNALTTFEISFNDEGGINDIGFMGNGYFMSKIGESGPSAPVRADVAIKYDFVNKWLHGVFEVFVNVPGIMQGINPGNSAGSAELHFDPNKWHVLIGTPDKRIGLRLAGLFKSTSYFMVGTDIPPMGSLPKKVTDILGETLPSGRNEAMLRSASGFAFGSSIEFNTGKLQFLMFYGQFEAGGGFDIMLQNLAGMQCEGRSGQIGVNGWYASGNAYVYVKGEVGINIDLVFVSGQFKILEIGAAATLQARLPNPSYLEGNVGGYYSILNGKIKGNCKFSLTIGEKCKIVGGSVVSGMKIITDVSPAEGSKNISVFNNPQATFNLTVEKPFELQDLDGSMKSFRVKLGHFKLITSKGIEVPGKVQWDNTNEVVAFQSHDILPKETVVKASVRVYFEELKNGKWEIIMVNGKIAEELKEASFTTGKAPDHISSSDVDYSYPLNNQFHFYKSEYNTGYVGLIKGRPDLFEEDNKWKRSCRFVSDKQKFEVPISYNAGSKMVSFNIPPALQNESIYNIDFVNTPAYSAGAIASNVKNINADSTQTLSIADKDIEGTRDVLQEKVFYTQNFRTSKYNTFKEKMSSWSISPAWSFPILSITGLHEVGVNVAASELLDKFELSNTLVIMEAGRNNNWFKKEIYPLIYKPLPIRGQTVSRDTTLLGLPPMRAIEMRQGNMDKILTESEVEARSSTTVSGYAQLIYNLPFYMYKDYADLRQKCANMSVSGNADEAIIKLLNTPFPGINSGNYDVNLNYTLPGIKKVSTSYRLIFKNP